MTRLAVVQFPHASPLDHRRRRFRRAPTTVVKRYPAESPDLAVPCEPDEQLVYVAA